MVSPARKIRPQPRRSPVQGRAQATVEAILKAAAQILARHGAEAATTNAIAERAGVSVGSLYQYFANREALLNELVRRHVDAMQAVLAAALDGLQGRSLPQAVEQLVAAIVASHRVSPRLHQALHQALSHGKVDTIDRFESQLEILVCHALRMHPALDLADPELTATLLVRALGGFIRTTLRREPERIDDPAVAAMMTAMILGTLERAQR
jgi:AcrR family transcriptional regulator